MYLYLWHIILNGYFTTLKFPAKLFCDLAAVLEGLRILKYCKASFIVVIVFAYQDSLSR